MKPIRAKKAACFLCGVRATHKTYGEIVCETHGRELEAVRLEMTVAHDDTDGVASRRTNPQQTAAPFPPVLERVARVGL